MARFRQEDFPYSKLSSIQTQTKMTSGGFVIFVSGNKAVISQVMPKERVNEIGEYVRARITAGDVPATATVPTDSPSRSPEERLRRLQAMFDGGLISEEELQSKRGSILDEL